jgi:hypothetical protein
MHWTDKYLYIPYRELDCALLVEKVQNEVFHRKVSFPSERNVGTKIKQELINNTMGEYAIATDTPIEGDLVVMWCRSVLKHIGVYFEINKIAYVLHSLKSTGISATTRISNLPQNFLSVEGYYTWL